MDADELLDYALGRLDAPRRERLERRIAGDPDLAERVQRLFRNLERLLDDGREDVPTGPLPDPPAPPDIDRST